MDEKALESELQKFDSFEDDASVQQLRLIDARPLTDGKLVYDTRINVIYNPKTKTWDVLSGISRVVKCGVNVTTGNSLLTNISSGAEIAPLIIGKTKPGTSRDNMVFGPEMSAILQSKTELDVPR